MTTCGTPGLIPVDNFLLEGANQPLHEDWRGSEGQVLQGVVGEDLFEWRGLELTTLIRDERVGEAQDLQDLLQGWPGRLPSLGLYGNDGCLLGEGVDGDKTVPHGGFNAKVSEIFASGRVARWG